MGDDRALIINGKRLDSSTPRFEKVYGFDPSTPPRDSHYSGHVNSKHVSGFRPAPYFDDRNGVVNLPKGNYMVMGDNTVNSLDSRTWGPFPSDYVIGKAFFVYWPITSRFARGYLH